MRRILLVRHCQSEANADGRIEGRGDSPLSELGRSQAETVAAFVAGMKLGEAVLIASSQSRAIATAAAIGAACGWDHIQDHRIREGYLGWMENIPYSEVSRHMAERKASELSSDIHGGESLAEVGDRLWEALEAAMTGSNDILILVSHGYSIQALLRRLDPDVALPRFIGNGDVVEMWLADGALAKAPAHYPLAAAAPHP